MLVRRLVPGLRAGTPGNLLKPLVCVQHRTRIEYTGQPVHFTKDGQKHISPHGPEITQEFFDSLPLTRERSKGSKRVGLQGMKCGMTQLWDKWGQMTPVTVIEVQEVHVTQTKTPDKEGFWALQLGGGWQKRRRVNFQQLGLYDKVGVNVKRYLQQFHVTEDAMLPVGTQLTAKHFVVGQYIDVKGITKGKGFAGGMKRHGFSGQPASHGNSKKHRHIGSHGGGSASHTGGNTPKGKKMAGRMGGKNTTINSLRIHKIDPDTGLIFVKGAVPGPKGGIVRMRDAIYPTKQIQQPIPFPTFFEGDPEPDMELDVGDEDPLARFYV